MSRKLHGLAALTLVVTASLSAALPAAAQEAAQERSVTDSDRAAAQEAHRHALELFDHGKHAEALAEFKRAYGLSPSFRILYNIGLSHVALGDWLAAREAFSTYLREGGERIPTTRRQQIEAEIEKLQERLASLSIDVDEPGAEVTVDGELLGKGPLSRKLPLNGGRHTVAVRSADGTLKTQSVTLSAGEEQRLRFQAPTATAPASTQLSVVPTQGSSARPAQREFPWLAWGITGALGAATAVAGGLALAARSDERDLHARQGVKRDELIAARDKVSNRALATDVLLAGTALAAGVSIYLTLRPGRAQPQTALVIAPGVVGLTHSF